MDIVILSNFCMDFSQSDNDRFLYIANLLAMEHSVEIVTSDFFHTQKSFRNQPVTEWPFKITFLHETGYSQNVCLKRFFSHYAWGKNVKKYLARRKKPDIVYCAVPSLTGPLNAAKYCNKNRIKFIIDIQDLWPEAFKMILDFPIISSLIFAPFNWMANGIYKRANEICAVSQTYVDRAMTVNHNCPIGHSVFLGTELNKFDQNCQSVIDISKNNLWLGYCGTLGHSYDLTCVFDALELIKNSNYIPPKFIIMGDGPLKERFEEYAHSKKIDCFFAGRLPYGQMCSLLKQCDMTINPIMHGAAQSIINKHADYAASGKPIINTQENDEFRNLVTKYHMGINCESNNANQVASAIMQFVQNEQLRDTAGKNARKCAEEKFDRKSTYSEIISVILK